MTNREYIRENKGDIAIDMLQKAINQVGAAGLKDWLDKPAETERKSEACANTGAKP